jgi:putative transposase
VLEIPASTYYAAKKRERGASARQVRDEQLKKEIMRVWEDKRKGRRLYGARKVWLQLRREGIEVARCTVERLMRELGIAGASARRKRPRTTIPAPAQDRPSDLLERDFTAQAPGRRWVADITYVATFRGFVYTAFVTDLFSRKIVGWQVSDTLRAELALDALEMAIWSSGDKVGDQLVHHSDRGVQYTSIRYGERLADIGAVRSVGSKGDSYDNAAAEAVNSLYKRAHRPGRPVARCGGCHPRHPGMGRLVQQRAAPLHLRKYPAERVRGKLLQSASHPGSIIVFGKQGPPNFSGRTS